MVAGHFPNSVQILCGSQKAFRDLFSLYCLATCVLSLGLCISSVPNCFKLPDALNHHNSLLSLRALLSDKNCLSLTASKLLLILQDRAQSHLLETL